MQARRFIQQALISQRTHVQYRCFSSVRFSTVYQSHQVKGTEEDIVGTMEREDIEKLSNMHPAGIHQSGVDQSGLGESLNRNNNRNEKVELPKHDFKPSDTIIDFSG